MQFRQMRYFVKIVDAGSFSRAAATIHVAQPALTHQIHELEEKLGVQLLQRSARGVRPTAAGEVLYREASVILRLLEQLPGVVRSSGGDAEGAVNLGLASSIARTVAGPFIEACKSALPKVTLKFSDFDSESIRGMVETSNLDLALLFEDEQVSSVSRRPLFRQRLYLLRRESAAVGAASISLSDLSKLPLVLPGQPNGRRSAIDRAFMAAGLTANVAVESGGAMSSELSAVRSGIGNAILPIGDFAGLSGDGLAAPQLIEPPLFLTASIISSSDFPLTNAGEAVCNLLIQFVGQHSRSTAMPGADWIN